MKREFVLAKEVNKQNLSHAQRIFLTTLTSIFHSKIGVFEPNIFYLTYIQIKQVIELFSRFLLNQIIEIQSVQKESTQKFLFKQSCQKLKDEFDIDNLGTHPKQKPKRKDLGRLLKRMDELAEIHNEVYTE